MALSGTISLTSSKAWRGSITWSATQDSINNYSTVYIHAQMWKTDGYLTSSNDYTDGTITIDGTSYELIGYQEFGKTSDDKFTIYEDTLTFYHDSNGNKSVSISLTCNGQTSTSLSGIQLTGSGTASLTQIDRTYPTVTHSISNITSDGFTITVTSSAKANRFQYSIDGGSSYTTFSTTADTSASYNVTGLTPGTSYSVRARARKQVNHLYGYSTAASVRTLGASTLNSAEDFAADANPMTITMNVKVTNAEFGHKLVLIKDSSPIFTAEIGTFTAGTEDRVVTLTSEQRTALLAQMATVTSTNVTLQLYSYVDTNYEESVGSYSQVACKATTSEELSAPTFTGFTYADIEEAIVAMTGNNQVLLQLHSHLEIYCNAAMANNGASITGYSATIGNVSGSSANTTIDIPEINATGDLTLTVSCSDSRGYATKVTKTVKVLPYQNPEFSSFRLRRENDIGSRIQLAFYGSVSSLTIDGAECNEITAIAYRYKKTSDEEWGEYVSLMDVATIDGLNFSYENLELLTLDTNTSYNFEVRIQDALYDLSTLDYEIVLVQGTPAIAIRKANNTYDFPRVGINNALPKHALDVGGDIAMNGFVVLGFRKVTSGENFDNLSCGIYFYPGNGTGYNVPVEAPGFLTAVTDGTHISQRFSEIGTTNPEYVRVYDGKKWTEWRKSGSDFIESADTAGCYCRTVGGEIEWLNPPMAEGTEYRTAERFMGAPVYTMLVNVGTSYSTNVTEYEWYDTYAVYPIRCAAQLGLAADYAMRSALSSTSLDTSGNTEISVCATNNKITYVCNDSGVGYEIYVQVWYTKTLTN